MENFSYENNNYQNTQKRVKRMIDVLTYIGDDKDVKIRISYVMDIYKYYGSNISFIKDNKLHDIMLVLLHQIKSALLLNKTYVNISTKDAITLLEKTSLLDFDKSMVIVTNGMNSYYKHRSK